MRQSGRVDLRPLLFEAEAADGGPVLREGHDFAGQSEVPDDGERSRPVGGPNLLRLVGEIGRYIYRAHIAGIYFTNFADAPAKVSMSADLVFRYGRAIGDETMAAFGAWGAAEQKLGSERTDSIGRNLPALFNLGELHYQANQPEAAASHVARAVEIERRHPEVAARPVARLLMARLFAYRGDLPAARAWLSEVYDVETSASVQGRMGARLSVSDQILAEMVELSLAAGGPERWADLCSRALADSVEQEAIEVHEGHGLAALRAGRVGEAEAALRAALSLADRIPNVMRPRVESRLAALAAERSS